MNRRVVVVAVGTFLTLGAATVWVPTTPHPTLRDFDVEWCNVGIVHRPWYPAYATYDTPLGQLSLNPTFVPVWRIGVTGGAVQTDRVRDPEYRVVLWPALAAELAVLLLLGGLLAFVLRPRPAREAA